MESPPVSRPLWLSLVTLLAGALALGIAAIPPLALGRPLGLAVPEKPPEPPTVHEGGLTFKHGKFEVTFGGRKEPVISEPTPKPTDHTRWFMVAAIGLALTTIVAGAIAFHREKNYSLAGIGISLSVLAIAWQYVIVGITIGIAIAIVLVLISALGSP